MDGGASPLSDSASIFCSPSGDVDDVSAVSSGSLLLSSDCSFSNAGSEVPREYVDHRGGDA